MRPAGRDERTSSAAGSVTSNRQNVAALTTATIAAGADDGLSESNSARRKLWTALRALCVTTPVVSSHRMVSRKGSRYSMQSCPGP